MTDINTGNPFYDMIMADYVGAKETQANRPIQTSQKTKPLEYADMLERRNQIGAERAALAKALEKRDNFGYRFANALSQMPAQQGAGSWLSDFARAFGAAYNAKTDMRIDKAERDYEKAQKDLADALMYNKAMGEEQIMGYTPFATGTKSQTKSKDDDGGVAQTSIGSKKVVPVKATQNDWDYWIKNWDKDRQTEGSYRNMGGLQRKIHNIRVGMGWGDKDETDTRRDFSTYMKSNFLPIARETLKGAGQISDFEDIKYTKWIEEAGDDPVALKDTAVRIVMDAANLNNFNDAQKLSVLESMNLQSNKEDLTDALIEQNPLRVRGYKLPEQGGGWTVLGNGVKIRKKQ